MRKFDHNGLLLAEYQGKLFENSSDLNCSSGIFLRRFLHSNLLVKLDTNNPSALSLDTNEGIKSIVEQFGDSDYGKLKYSKNALFWIGYMYRYISYTREKSTRFLFKIFDYKQLNEVYFSFHTQDPEWCVRNLLELNRLTESVFDNNYRLKEIIRKKEHY
ncbi:MAG: antitoxin [Lachnospiraceae bacterium]|nr:antitoxin [Lachnospiraceae bacterium]